MRRPLLYFSQHAPNVFLDVNANFCLKKHWGESDIGKNTYANVAKRKRLEYFEFLL